MEEHFIDIKGIVEKVNKAISESPPFHRYWHIHRVSEGLRRAKPEAYEPIVVSIGPYHLKNPKVQAMKNHKLWYLCSLLERRKEKVEKYIVEMKKLEDRVRNCYVEPIHDLNSEEFVEMMLLDACFIIEFFRQNHINTILNVDCMEGQICRDLMLLENQLPFFLLSRFYDMTQDPKDPEDPDYDDRSIEVPNLNLDPDENPFLNMAMSIINLVIPEKNLNSCKLDQKKIKHLLHLVHVVCRPALPEQKASLEINTIFEIKNQMHSAMELEEAGVKFMNSDTAHVFDKKFDNGSIVFPCFYVNHQTETFFRNLIAFEQHSTNAPKYFADSAYFMDELINSEIDVKLLRNKGIIKNYLSDDKEVSNLFNKLCDGVVSYTTFYEDDFSKVDEHYNKPLNRMRAKLVRAHNYFDPPWATASTIAAIVLLLLTLLQTIAVFIYK